MERTVNVTVDATGGIIPKTPQYAGVQGEHNACRVTFDVSAWSAEPFVYRGEFVSGDGTGGTTDVLEAEEGCVSFPLPAAWTAAGGRAVARLVASVTVDGEETQTVYAVDVPLYFAAKQECSAAVKAEEYAGLTALVTSVQETVDEVERRLADGSFIGPQGERGEKGERGVQGVSGVYVGSGEMPEGYNIQIDPDGDASLRLAIGEVVTLPEGEEATATVTGTPDAPVLNLGIPRGATGSQGAQGERGEQGEPGQDLTDKPWVMLEKIALTEDVTKIVPNFPEHTYTQLFIRGKYTLTRTDGQTSGTVNITLGNAAGGLSFSRITNAGSTTAPYYYVAEGNVAPDRLPTYEVFNSMSPYAGSTTAKNLYRNDVMPLGEYLPAFAVYISTNGVYFAAGSTFEIWGR